MLLILVSAVNLHFIRHSWKTTAEMEPGRLDSFLTSAKRVCPRCGTELVGTLSFMSVTAWQQRDSSIVDWHMLVSGTENTKC